VEQSMKIVIDYSELEKLEDKTNQAQSKVGMTAKEGLAWAGDRFVRHMRDTLRFVEYTGKLGRSVKIHEATEDYVTIGPDAESVPYTEYVLHGRAGREEPFTAIYAWTISKLGKDMRVAYAIWHGIRRRGTSTWARMYYPEELGGYPFPRLTLERPAGQETLKQTALRIGKSIIAEIAK